jgi:hypothetical protein
MRRDAGAAFPAGAAALRPGAVRGSVAKCGRPCGQLDGVVASLAAAAGASGAAETGETSVAGDAVDHTVKRTKPWARRAAAAGCAQSAPAAIAPSGGARTHLERGESGGEAGGPSLVTLGGAGCGGARAAPTSASSSAAHDTNRAVSGCAEELQAERGLPARGG